MLNSLVKGIAIGLFFAVPVGPIGILCVRRSLAVGRSSGLATGLGAATADAAYGAVAAFGLTAISGFLTGQRFWLGLVGGVFLCYLGIQSYRSKPVASTANTDSAGLFAAYSSTLLLTITNPMTIFSFVAVFAGFGVEASPSYAAATGLVAGVFLGSASWWLVLSGGVALFRSRFNLKWMQVVNRVSGGLIIGFGLYTLATLYFHR